MLNTKIISSLDKVFLDQSINDFSALERLSALRGERISVQLIYAYDIDDRHKTHMFHTPVLLGELAKYATVRNVKQIPLVKYDGDDSYPKIASISDYLRYPPGLFPDPLSNLAKDKIFAICDKLLDSLWIDITVPENMKAGEYTLTVRIDEVENQTANGMGEAIPASVATTTIEIIDALLPERLSGTVLRRSRLVGKALANN